MIRFFFRLMATLMLAVGAIMAVLDATRTVAAKSLVLTPLQTSWQATFPDSLASFQALLETGVHPLAWDPIALFVLGLPGFVVFAIIALLVERKLDSLEFSVIFIAFPTV